MPLANSREAIGQLGELLQAQLTARTSVNTVDVGRPEVAATSGGPKLNLFLYQMDFDGHMRNLPLDQGQAPPLWMVLRYLLTAFDQDNDSDTAAAHRVLGEGLLALHELNFIDPPATSLALADNPEPLKVTFDPGDSELLSKLMQGVEDHYRLSAAFQVRPIMLVPATTPGYAPAVQTVGPPTAPGVVVIPSMGPRLDRVEPERFEAGAQITLFGRDLGEIQEVCFGTVCLAPDDVGADTVLVTVPPPPATTLSAGGLPITAVRILPSGRRFASNAVLGHLLPTLQTATPVALVPSGGGLSGDLVLDGERLGSETDSIFVAFYGSGGVALMLEVAGSAAQISLTATVTPEEPLAAGTYRVILRVNGAQAIESPEVTWT